MSLISESLKRVAAQRAGRKQPPVIPRRIAGQRPERKKRLLMLLGLTMLLAGVVIGVVVYGMIQRKAGQKASEEAPTSVPQQVIFDKIPPLPQPSKSDAVEESLQAREPQEDERTQVKPKVVQVASEQESLTSEETVTKPSPVQPSNKVKVGLVSLHSAEKVTDDKEPLHLDMKRQSMAPEGESSKPEHLGAPDSSGTPRKIMITEGKEQDSAKGRKSGQVNLRAETTAGTASLYRKAVSYQKTMKWQKAIETYNELLRLEPMSAEVYNNIGVCYEKQGQLKMAAKSYEKAISINPRFYPSYNNLGIIYYRLRDFDKARAAYEQALQLNPGNSQSEVNLALVYERLRRGELARRTLERVLTNDPENPEAHYNLARMLEEQGQHEQALTHYRQFLASTPSSYPQLREKVEDRVRTLEGPANK